MASHLKMFALFCLGKMFSGMCHGSGHGLVSFWMAWGQNSFGVRCWVARWRIDWCMISLVRCARVCHFVYTNRDQESFCLSVCLSFCVCVLPPVCLCVLCVCVSTVWLPAVLCICVCTWVCVCVVVSVYLPDCLIICVCVGLPTYERNFASVVFHVVPKAKIQSFDFQAQPQRYSLVTARCPGASYLRVGLSVGLSVRRSVAVRHSVSQLAL